MSTELIDDTPDSLRAGALGVQGEGEPTQTISTEPPKAEEELDEHGEPKKKPGGFQRRIQKLTERQRATDARLAAVEEENARLKAGLPAPKAEAQPAARPEAPDEDSFDNYSDFKKAERKYFEDLADWKAKEAVRLFKEEQEERSTKAKEKEEADKVQETWATRLEAAHEAHPDLEDLLEEDLPVSPAMEQNLKDSEVGGELLYYLASNPEECRRIAQLSPMAATRAIGRIEAALIASQKTPEPKAQEQPPKRTSSAPAPLQPLKGSGSATKDPSKLSDAEWLRSSRKR